MNSNNGRFSLTIHNGTEGSGYLFIPKYMRSAPGIEFFMLQIVRVQFRYSVAAAWTRAGVQISSTLG